MDRPLPTLLAQNTICGPAGEENWLCLEVLERTQNQFLARISNLGTTLLSVAVILVGAWVVTRLLRRLVTRFATRMELRIAERLDRAQEREAIDDAQSFRTRRLQRLHAIAGVLRGAIGVTVWLIAILMVITEIGLPLQPLLAGAGLAGVVLGFGAQQLVRDVLAGIAMLIEDQYGVGDWIEVDGQIGVVERVGLRSTAFRDVHGVVHHVLNGYIQRVGNLSQEWARATFDVPIALDADIPAAKALIFRVATELTEDPLWGQDTIGPPEIWGVQELGPAGIRIRVVIPTKPMRNFDVTRQLRERLKFALEQNGIRMPSQLVEVGGMPSGYALLNQEVDHAPPERPTRRRGLVPPGVGRYDRPERSRREHGEPGATGHGEHASTAAPAAEPTPPEPDGRDLTAELRIEKGPLPRPD